VKKQTNVRLPGFSAESSMVNASVFSTHDSFWPLSGAGVVSAGSDVTCNCGCPCSGTTGGGGGTGGGGTSNPGVCQCSSVLGIGCSVSANNCNPGFVPTCNCGVFGNSCQCVPGT
jgi:hypothetical protein